MKFAGVEMKLVFSKKELKLLKQIARKSKPVNVGYIQCLNTLANASGYENWKNLKEDNKVLAT